MASDSVPIEVYDGYGPLFGNSTSNWIQNVAIFSNGTISIPNAYDRVDGWLSTVQYRLNGGNWTNVTTDASGSKLLGGITWPMGDTTVEWRAIDNRGNYNENSGYTYVTNATPLPPPYSTGTANSYGLTQLYFETPSNCIDKGYHFAISDYCLLYTSPSPRDGLLSRMPSSA